MFDMAAARHVVFSPDSRHFAYFGRNDKGNSIVVDGVEIGVTVAPCADLVFDSPDSLHTIMMSTTDTFSVVVKIKEKPGK
jgi:hypothetical protein